MQEGLCWDEEGSRAHPEQGDELQKPEAAEKSPENSSWWFVWKITLFIIQILFISHTVHYSVGGS